MPLNITEARKKLPELVKRAEYAGEEIELGPRGKRSAVLIGAEVLEELRRRLDRAMRELARLRAGGASRVEGAGHGSTWAIVGEALDRMKVDERGAHVRRFIPELRTDSDLSREERRRIGRLGAGEPEFRRLPASR